MLLPFLPILLNILKSMYPNRKIYLYLLLHLHLQQKQKHDHKIV